MRVKYSAFLVTACAVLFVSGCGRSKNGAGLTGSASDVVGPVTDQLLQGGQRADPAIWPTYGGDWAQTRYSALTDIRRETVQRLRPAWIYQTGILGTFETTPVVLGRGMYITTPVSKGRQDVLRLDATTGEVVWRVELTSRGVTNGAPQPFFDLHLPSDFGPNRGVAVYGDRVYVGTLNGTLLALDRRTGHKIFEVATLSPRLTSAPLAARGRIIVGLSWVARGAIQAFNAQTGKELWTWWAIPSPENGGWWGTWTDTLPGFPHVSLGRDIAREKADSARLTDSWKSGGGGAPMTPTFDPESGLLYTSTGHPDPAGFPPPSEPYPGDMRWTSSICAIHIETGETAWCYQLVPHDVWGSASPTPPILFELQHGGERIDAVGKFSGMGNFYIWNRRDGKLVSISDNYIPADPTVKVQAGPNLIRGGWSGTNWSPGAYDPQTALFYSANGNTPGYFEPHAIVRPKGAFGNIAAVNGSTGRVAWSYRTALPQVGGTLATAGGLVFAGRTSGWFDAYNARTGDRVWSFRTGASCSAARMTYQTGGVQYVVIACGGHEIYDPQGGDALIAFSLGAVR